MIEISFQRRWLQTTISAIRFSQSLIQGLWNNESSLLQLPFFTENEVKYAIKNFKNPSKALYDYIRLPDSDKKGVASFNEEQKQEIYQTCKLFPKLAIEIKVFVEDEEDTNSSLGDEDSGGSNKVNDDFAATVEDVSGDKIFENDIVTVRVILTRTNLSVDEDCGPVYSPRFPKVVKEGWWLLLSDRPKADPRRPGAEAPQPSLHAAEKLTSQKRVVKHDLRFQAPPIPGQYTMDLHILSDCYAGLDEEHEFSFIVHPASELPAFVPHPEDAQLDNDPTLFEQMLAGNVDAGSSDEEDAPALENIDTNDSSDDDNDD